MLLHSNEAITTGTSSARNIAIRDAGTTSIATKMVRTACPRKIFARGECSQLRGAPMGSCLLQDAVPGQALAGAVVVLPTTFQSLAPQRKGIKLIHEHSPRRVLATTSGSTTPASAARARIVPGRSIAPAIARLLTIGWTLVGPS